jgi:hypothetical protein
MLEPDPNFTGSPLYAYNSDCKNNFVYFDTANKKWNCPWEVNSKSNWLTTDGTKIVIDTSLAPISFTFFTVET